MAQDCGCRCFGGRKVAWRPGTGFTASLVLESLSEHSHLGIYLLVMMGGNGRDQPFTWCVLFLSVSLAGACGGGRGHNEFLGLSLSYFGYLWISWNLKAQLVCLFWDHFIVLWFTWLVNSTVLHVWFGGFQYIHRFVCELSQSVLEHFHCLKKKSWTPQLSPPAQAPLTHSFFDGSGNH